LPTVALIGGHHRLQVLSSTPNYLCSLRAFSCSRKTCRFFARRVTRISYDRIKTRYFCRLLTRKKCRLFECVNLSLMHKH
jgi:hypothetical protein